MEQVTLALLHLDKLLNIVQGQCRSEQHARGSWFACLYQRRKVYWHIQGRAEEQGWPGELSFNGHLLYYWQVVYPQGEVQRVQGEWKDGFLEGKGRIEQTAGGWQEAIFR